MTRKPNTAVQCQGQKRWYGVCHPRKPYDLLDRDTCMDTCVQTENEHTGTLPTGIIGTWYSTALACDSVAPMRRRPAAAAGPAPVGWRTRPDEMSRSAALPPPSRPSDSWGCYRYITHLPVCWTHVAAIAIAIYRSETVNGC